MPPLKIAIVGTGNVGFHLAQQLSKNVEPVAIASRDLNKSQQLIDTLNLSSKGTTIHDLYNLDVDLVILSVPDSAIKQVIKECQFPEKSIIVHTSGSQPMNLLKKSPRHGVLYPFQTFTKSKPTDFSQIPIFIEGIDEECVSLIRRAAMLLNDDVREVISVDRFKIHLAAVFACNFSNHLYTIAEEILQGTGGKLADLNHLMKETVDKAVGLNAREAQTGPAIRGDMEVIARHLDLLNQLPDARQVYQLLSDQISSKR
ncbi:MAG: DUF2520 domain-containing protein [Cyclobacteriaceae bacterium]